MVRQKPIRASKFVTLPKNVQDLLIYNGAVPVNDVFFPHWYDDSNILLLFGGFGSGKSVFYVDRLIDNCLNDSYFRCFYGRKVYKSVRESIFLTFTDRIEERGLIDYFIYSKSDNSSMIIKAKDNGNAFYPFGADNPRKLQSIKDPSHIVAEEFSEFAAADFEVLLTRLRTQKVRSKFIGVFNTTRVKQTHWIKNAFFNEENKNTFTEFKITKVFCNYPDNYFLDKKQYEETLWVAAFFNQKKFDEIATGAWGVEEVGNPFIYNFEPKRHILPGLTKMEKHPIILSFDFNVEPITCLVSQINDMQDDIRYLDEYRLMNSDIEELCQRILSDYPDDYLLVTGDASGQSRTALKRDLTYYKQIKRILLLNQSQFKLPGANPPVKSTRVLCNAILKKHPNCHFSDRVPYLITDIEQCEVDENGDIDKSKDKHKSHLLDCYLYTNWTFLHNFVSKYE